MTIAKAREHEALIVVLAKQRNIAGLDAELASLSMMPQFSGVRGQVLKLYVEAKKLARKFKLNTPNVPELPYMVRLPIYTSPSATLLTIQPPVLVSKIEKNQNCQFYHTAMSPSFERRYLALRAIVGVSQPT